MATNFAELVKIIRRSRGENRSMSKNPENRYSPLANKVCSLAKVGSSVFAISLGVLLAGHSGASAHELNASSIEQNVKQQRVDDVNRADTAARPLRLNLLLDGRNNGSSKIVEPAAYYSVCSTAYGTCPDICDFPGEACACLVPGGTVIGGRCF